MISSRFFFRYEAVSELNRMGLDEVKTEALEWIPAKKTIGFAQEKELIRDSLEEFQNWGFKGLVPDLKNLCYSEITLLLFHISNVRKGLQYDHYRPFEPTSENFGPMLHSMEDDVLCAFP